MMRKACHVRKPFIYFSHDSTTHALCVLWPHGKDTWDHLSVLYLFFVLFLQTIISIMKAPQIFIIALYLLAVYFGCSFFILIGTMDICYLVLINRINTKYYFKQDGLRFYQAGVRRFSLDLPELAA